MKKLYTLTLGALLLALASGAQATLLTDLLAGNSIQAGDKLFTDWAVVFEDSHDGHVFNTDNIDVSALNDGGLDPGPGLDFSIFANEFSVEGDGVLAFKKFVFEFQVTVLDPLLRIKDVSMGILSGSINTPLNGDSGVAIFEDVGTTPGDSDLALLDVGFDQLNGVLMQDLIDSADFAPQSSIWVTKEIFVWAVELDDGARLFNFDQRFSQTAAAIPLPQTSLLMVIGLAAFGAARRRQV